MNQESIILLTLLVLYLFAAGSVIIVIIQLGKMIKMAYKARHELFNAMDAARVVIEEEFSKKVISQRAFDDALKDLGLKLTRVRRKLGRPRKTKPMSKTKKKEQ